MKAQAICVLFALGCSADLAPTSRTTALDPFAIDDSTLPLVQRQAVLERRAIFLGNQLASQVFEEAANLELNTLGIQGHYRDLPMTPSAERGGEVTLDTRTPTDLVTPEVPAGTANIPPEACAFAMAAPAIDASSVSCRYLARQTIGRAETRGVQAFAAEPLSRDFMQDAMDPLAVQAWYREAFDYGVVAGESAFVASLRQAGVCDREPTQEDSAQEKGAVIGRELLSATVATREAATPRTSCNTDAAIVNPAVAAAMTEAPMLGESPLCATYVPQAPAERARLAVAQAAFAAGITAGIEEQARIESGRLVREWVCDRGNDGGGGGGSGDPLILDFDGDAYIHLETIATGALFDFGAGPVRTEWPVADAFLVYDRNQDGAVEAAELFGDVSVFSNGERARDGVEAAGIYDSADYGGNADGRLDASDAVFQSLSVWVDRDGDGSTDEGELTSLSDAGVSEVDFTNARWFDAEREEHFLGEVWLDYSN